MNPAIDTLAPRDFYLPEALWIVFRVLEAGGQEVGVDQGANVSVELSATDVDGDALTFAATARTTSAKNPTTTEGTPASSSMAGLRISPRRLGACSET